MTSRNRPRRPRRNQSAIHSALGSPRLVRERLLDWFVLDFPDSNSPCVDYLAVPASAHLLFRALLPLLALHRPRDLLVFFRHLGEAVPPQVLRPRPVPFRRRLGMPRLLWAVLDRHLLPHEDAARLPPAPASLYTEIEVPTVG